MTASNIWLQVHEPLSRYVMGQTRDRQATQDILQNIFLRMQAGLSHLQDQDKMMPWLYRIARHAIADYYRAEKRAGTLTSKMAFAGQEEPADGSQSENLTQEFAQCIPAMLEVLPEKYREALYLTEIKGFSQKELADHLGISYSGAKSRVQRGREKLREVLLDCCYIHTDVYGNIIDYGDRRNGQEDC